MKKKPQVSYGINKDKNTESVEPKVDIKSVSAKVPESPIQKEVAKIKQTSQGVVYDEKKQQDILALVNSKVQEKFGNYTDDEFEQKLLMASTEELMRMAVKVGIIPVGDVRKLRKQLKDKREKLKATGANRADKTLYRPQPTKELQSKVDEILKGKLRKDDKK